MGKQKYNWIELKIKFFESEYWEVSEFIRQRLGKNKANDGNILRKTKGRKLEKIKLYQDFMQEFKPSGKALQKLRQILEKACEFIPELIKAWMIGKTKNMTQYGNYPTIKEITKFISLIEPFSNFGFKTNKNISEIFALGEINEEELVE